jgi:hypothetical protein
VWQQNWSITILFFVLSGVYAIKSGTLDNLLAAGSKENCRIVLSHELRENGTAVSAPSPTAVSPGGYEEDYDAFEDKEDISFTGGMVVVLVWTAIPSEHILPNLGGGTRSTDDCAQDACT